MVRPLSVEALAAWLSELARPAPCIVDVREAWEREISCLAFSVHIPFAELREQLPALANRPIVALCHHGVRSYRAALLMEAAGLAEVYNLVGGIEAWSLTIDPTVRRY